MTKHTTHNAPATEASDARSAAGPVGRWLAGLGLGYVVLLAAIGGGLVWLVLIHPLGMRHGPALLLSIGTGLLTFARLCAYRADHAPTARTGTGPNTRRR